MNRKKKQASPIGRAAPLATVPSYDSVLSDIVGLLDMARRASARTVNAIMTATYWELGRRIVELEQKGKGRANYGDELLKRLSADLTLRFGRGFSYQSLYRFRQSYVAHPPEIFSTALRKSQSEKWPTASAKSGTEILSTALRESQDEKCPTVSGKSGPEIAPTGSAKSGNLILSTLSRESQPPAIYLHSIAARFPLPWAHYVRLLSVANPLAREFYETEALRGGWTVRQLDRQIGSQFYERTALSRNRMAMLRKGGKPRPEDAVSAEEEIRDPLVLEFLGLKDEYSETDLEDALVRHLESFLLELGNDFAFVGRQKRLRIDNEWFRVDLLFFHRRLRSLVVIDLKTGPLSHADIGQMHLYLNYARAHWVQPDENPPVGLILCTERGESLARYALEGLPNKMLIREYRTALPSEELLAAEIRKARRQLELRAGGREP